MTQALAAIKRNFLVDFLQRSGNIIEGVQLRICPLNRTQRPRLNNMRVINDEKGKVSNRNFLTTLLEKDSPLWRERKVRKKAMVHWFMRGQENYENQVLVEKTALHGAIIDGLARTRVDDVLNEVECQFQFKLLGLSACRL